MLSPTLHGSCLSGNNQSSRALAAVPRVLLREWNQAGRDGCAGSSNSVCSCACVCVHLGVLCVQVCAEELCPGSERESYVGGCCMCICTRGMQGFACVHKYYARACTHSCCVTCVACVRVCCAVLTPVHRYQWGMLAWEPGCMSEGPSGGARWQPAALGVPTATHACAALPVTACLEGGPVQQAVPPLGWSRNQNQLKQLLTVCKARPMAVVFVSRLQCHAAAACCCRAL